jgi:D-lactate dehydrogenase
MKIAFFDTDQKDTEALQAIVASMPNAADLQCTFTQESITAENAEKFADAEAICIFVHSAITEEIIQSLPALKVICAMSTGFDHIDAAAAQKRGITICTVPGYGTHTVAEYAFSLILGISRKTFAATRHMKETHSFDTAAFEGFDLFGKTIGVVGTGRIGLNVARIAKGFGMRVIAFDVFPNAAAAAEIGYEYMPLEQLLSESDVVSLHVPYNKDTHHLINTSNIMGVKPGAVLINTARGEVLDTQAVVAALNANLLSGVGMDVIEGERIIGDEWQLISKNTDTASAADAASAAASDLAHYKTLLEEHMLIDRPEVFITPHIAFFSREAKHEILKITVDNLNAFAAGKPQNQIPS